MKGYWTTYGYLGYVNRRWILFANDQECREYLEECDDGY